MPEPSCMVSVICITYNHEAYIAEALESFLKQKTDFAVEILVNDDASRDQTAAIVRAYAERCPDRIRAFLQRENQFCKGGNIENDILLPHARGKYVAFCEGDDFWSDPEKLQRQVDFLEANPDYAACVHETTIRYCDGAAPDELFTKRWNTRQGDRDLELSDILPGMAHAYHTSSLLFRRTCGADFPDYFDCGVRYGFADYPRALFLRSQGKIRFLDRAMSVYRVRSNQDSWSANVDGQYEKLRHFILGQIDVLRLYGAHVQGEDAERAAHELLEREFELMYIDGRDREQRRGPYRQILRKKPLAYRVKNLIKCCFPALQSAHRRRRRFGETHD